MFLGFIILLSLLSLTIVKFQSFGEVREITRVPNGDLHIDFRDSEVADTVGYK